MNSLDQMHFTNRIKSKARLMNFCKASLLAGILLSFDIDDLRGWFANSIIYASIFFGINSKIDLLSGMVFAGVKDLEKAIKKE